MTRANIEALVAACQTGDPLARLALQDWSEEQNLLVTDTGWEFLTSQADGHSESHKHLATTVLVDILAKDWSAFWLHYYQFVALAAQVSFLPIQPVNDKRLVVSVCTYGTALIMVPVEGEHDRHSISFRGACQLAGMELPNPFPRKQSRL